MISRNSGSNEFLNEFLTNPKEAMSGFDFFQLDNILIFQKKSKNQTSRNRVVNSLNIH